MTSLDRGLDVLMHIANDGPMTAETVAERSGLPLSTTYRYLTTLRTQRYVVDYGGHFDLGVRMLRMLKPTALNRGLATLSSPVMFALVAKTNETALLTVREGWTATCIELTEPHRTVRFSYRRGVSLSLHRGASAKPLLAYSEPAFIHQYLDSRVSWEEDQDTTATLEQLGKIRDKGYCLTASELDSGAIGIGVPVFWDGEIAACLSLVGPTFRLNDRRLKEAVGHTIDAGRELSALLSNDAAPLELLPPVAAADDAKEA